MKKAARKILITMTDLSINTYFTVIIFE